ncbi:MAG: hypothetical protein IJR16_07605 [Spirochaetales bacterium]|nr:hypothetical protein [Spirochaetales bacterium]
MQTEKSYRQLKAAITKEEQEQAVKLAKSQGMTFQGWFAKIIRAALREAADGNRQ